MRLWPFRKRKEPRPGARPLGRIIDDILPPEGVPVRFEVAGLGARMAAQITDFVVTMAFLIGAILLLSQVFDADYGLLSAFAVILSFALRVPYHILTELFWNGRTLGKSMLGLRVVSGDGRALTPYAIVVRNMMKEAEVFAPTFSLLVIGDLTGGIITLVWVAILLTVPLFNKRRQRIGDILANTYVIVQPVALLMPDLTETVTKEARGFTFFPNQLDHYGAYELQTLERLLQAAERPDRTEAQVASLETVVETIRTKIDFADPVPKEEAVAFLQSFYRAQRLHLEFEV